MPIEDLKNIMPTPHAPIESHGKNWESIECDIGTALPTDYKLFIKEYGSGRISEFVWIFNPFSKRASINLLNQVSLQLGALNTVALEFGEKCPYSLFPENEGLLPLGMTDNGDVIHWLMKGEPANWKIVVNESRGSRYEEFDGDLTAFLRKILTRESQCSLFPKDFPQGTPKFETIRDVKSR